MSKEMMEIKGLEIGYRQSSTEFVKLTEPADASLRRGNLTALIGPNGTGKTTLIKTMAGLLKPLSGDVLIDNQSASQFTKAQMALKLSLVLTEQPDDYFLKVEDVVAGGRYPYTGFWARLSGYDYKIIDECMQLAGIKNLKTRRINSLSDGERQKVMIAKALAQNTPIIILDEPSAFLDYPSKIELMHLLKSLTQTKGKTILFSSHDLELVLRTADSIWLMAPSMPMVTGIPEQLVVDGLIQQYFKKDGLDFDPYHAHFRLQKPTGISFSTQGDSLQLHWASNALIRLGYIKSDTTKAHMRLSFENPLYCMYVNDKNHTFDTIEKLIYGLENIEN